MPMTADRWARWVVGFVVFVLVIGVGVRAVRDSTTADPKTHRGDFDQYVKAGEAVVSGSDIYEAKNPRGMVYTALPIYAIAMVPFTFLNMFWSSIVWYVLCVLMFGYALRLSASLGREFCPECQLPDFWLQVLLALLVLPLALSALSRLNPSILITYLVTLCVWLYMRERVWASGFCLAASIVVKIFPALLLVYFLFQRKFRLAAITALWLFVFVVLVPSAVFGVHGNRALLSRWFHDYVVPMNSPADTRVHSEFWECFKPYGAGNQSVQAVFERLMVNTPTLAHRLSTAVNVVLVLITAWACRPRVLRPDGRALLQLCAIMPLMLLVSPLSWSHYFILLLLPLSVALATSRRDTASFGRSCARLGLASYAAGLGLAMLSHSLYKFGILSCGAAGLWVAWIVWLRCGRTSSM